MGELAEQKQDTQLINIVQNAITNPDITSEKLNELLDFHIRLEERQAFKNYNMSLVRAISQIPSMEKAGKVDMKLKDGRSVKYDFAKFEHILKVVKPILAENDLAIRFFTDYEKKDGHVNVTARLSHIDGHSEETSHLVPFDNTGSKNTVQSQGSSTSYGKRYTMSSLLGLSTHEKDDDGFASQKRITKEHIEKLNNGILVSGVDLDDLLKFMGVSNLGEILLSNFSKAANFLKQAVAAKEFEASNDNK